MGLVASQWAFLLDVRSLIDFIEAKGWSASGGELQRTLYQQQEYLRTGRSKTLNSLHIHKLALDLALFDPTGRWVQDPARLREFGVFWEDLNPVENEWGGFWDFVDVAHFQRRLPE